MIASATRLASLQGKILMLQAKLTVQRILLAAMLWTAAIVVGILAVIFLYIGIFKVLATYVMPSPWVWILYAVAHLVIAAGLVVWARSIFGKSEPDTTPPKERAADAPVPAAAPASH